MGRLVFGTCLAGALLIGSHAAVVAAPSLYDWTGFYAGGNIGGGWAHVSGPIDLAATADTAASAYSLHGQSSGSFTGGGQVGFQQQFDQWVFGAEGDFDFSSSRSAQTIGANPPDLFVTGDRFSAKSSIHGSVRVRGGYAWDRFLAYVTGGVGFAPLKVASDFIATEGFPATTAQASSTLVGGIFGGGLAYAINDNLSIAAEGSFASYGTHTFDLGSVAVFGPPFEDSPAVGRLGLHTTEALVKLSWKFN
jgi:outer membrane immunogenic protein